MQVPSLDVDMAMSLVLVLWPDDIAVMVVRCADKDLRGDSGIVDPLILREGGKKDSRSNKDHTWMLESGDPEKRKVPDTSVARQVTGCR